MKLAATFSFIAFFIAISSARAESINTDFPREIATQCAAKWPDRPQLQGRCIDQQTNAAFALIAEYRRARRTVERDAIARCLRRWRGSPMVTANSFDYRMAKQCADNQMATR